MYLRIDKLQYEMPAPTEPDTKAAAAVQDLLGGRFGEMSTLMNYTYQSFNMRGHKKIQPYYELVSSIAAEELGHIELVAATINGLLTGAVPDGDPDSAPLKGIADDYPGHFLANGAGARVAGAGGEPWQGDYVFNTGNLKLDLLHNFFLECGARMGKLRVYEATDHPIARAMCGYLLVRGGVHAVAYAKALETLTGVEVTKLLPIPEIPTDKIPEAKKFMDTGAHQKLYTFSPDDYKNLSAIWNGTTPEDGSAVEVVDGHPEGGEKQEYAEAASIFVPGYDPGKLADIAAKLMESR